MRSMKMYTSAAVALVTVALGATSASAANWDPVNMTVAGSGPVTVTTNSVGSFTCKITISQRSTGNDLAASVAPPVFDNCTSNIANPTTVTSSTSWTFQATTTTLVDFTGSLVANIGGDLCTITASWAVPNNDWSNAAHTLTLNSGFSFPIVEHGFCDGATSAHWSGTIAFPATAIIT